uniref:Integrase catalytic domain-containing protein n=1 Tax=Strigamia maritima TaxID=126957 RepID=T1IH71_STRMM
MFELNGRMNEVELKDVCYVENLSKNLISIGKIDDAGCEVRISPVTCKRAKQPRKLNEHNDHTQGQGVNKPVGPRKASKVEMTRFLNTKRRVCTDETQKNVNDFQLGERKKSLRPISNKHKIKCLRSRPKDRDDLAHSESLVECSKKLQLLKIENRRGESPIPNKRVSDIVPNLMAQNLGANVPIPFKPCEVLHLSLWGPSPRDSLGLARYILCIVDGFAKYSWFYPLKSLRSVSGCVEEFVRKAKRMHKSQVSRVTLDASFNLVLRDLGNSLRWLGVECDQIPSCALNAGSLAGEVCRDIMSQVQNLLAGNDAWDALWAEFAMGLCYTRNMSPYLGNAGEIPWILLKERPVPERDLHHPGDIVQFVHESTVRHGVLVGYSLTERRCYRVWDPNSNKIIEKGPMWVFADCPRPFEAIIPPVTSAEVRRRRYNGVRQSPTSTAGTRGRDAAQSCEKLRRASRERTAIIEDYSNVRSPKSSPRGRRVELEPLVQPEVTGRALPRSQTSWKLELQI